MSYSFDWEKVRNTTIFTLNYYLLHSGMPVISACIQLKVDRNTCIQTYNNFNTHAIYFTPHQWRIASEIKAGRRKVTGSIPVHAGLPSRSEFSAVFLQNSRKYGLGSLRKTPTEGAPRIIPGPISWQSNLNLHNRNPKIHRIHFY